jgi:NAD(P)-dependent dehydrogenase (short-subunit alcohol dehydrogenase family)
MSFQGKIVVIMGASTGIGREVAIVFGREKATTILAGRNMLELRNTAEMVRNAGGQAECKSVNLADKEELLSFADDVKKKYKKIEVLCNIAGIWHGEDEVYAGKDYETFSQQVVLDTFMVGAIAPSLLVRALIPNMPKGSSIINLSGTFESGAKGWLPYYVSKRAIEDLTVGLSEELREKEIRINCISPSDVATQAYKKFFPQYLKDAIDPEEIGKFAVSLCLEKAKDINGKVFVLKKDEEPHESFHA